MDPTTLADNMRTVADEAARLAQFAQGVAEQAALVATNTVTAHAGGFFLTGLTVFILACFVGYYVVWKVTPALHSPLMAVTNAISSVIIVGAIIAAGPAEGGTSAWLGFSAAILAAINIFGGFIVTQRMLAMYKKKEK